MIFFSAILKSVRSNYIKNMSAITTKEPKKKIFRKSVVSCQERRQKYWEMLDKLSNQEFTKEIKRRIGRLEKIIKDDT